MLPCSIPHTKTFSCKCLFTAAHRWNRAGLGCPVGSSWLRPTVKMFLAALKSRFQLMWHDVHTCKH